MADQAALFMVDADQAAPDAGRMLAQLRAEPERRRRAIEAVSRRLRLPGEQAAEWIKAMLAAGEAEIVDAIINGATVRDGRIHWPA